MTRQSLAERVHNLIGEAGTDLESPLVGLSSTEIEALEAQTGFRLPKAYRQLLELLGKSDGNLLAQFGTLPDRMLSPELQAKEASEVMAEVGDQLPEGAFVLHVHLADEVYYFVNEAVRAEHDPPVVQWLRSLDDENRHHHRWNAFSEFVLWAIGLRLEHLRLMRNRGR